MQGMRFRTVVAWTALALASWGPSAGATPMYNVANLGPLDPIGLNNQGEVGLTGYPISDIGGFGTVRNYLFTPSTYLVYQSRGSAAGTVSAPGGQGTSPGGTTSPWVNAAGDFAGTEAIDGRLQPYVSIGGVKTQIPMMGNGLMDPKAINASGQVVGAGFVPTSHNGYNAFLFSGGVLHDLGTFGGRNSGAEAINNQGTIVGWAMLAGPSPYWDGPTHAFMYDGTMHDLSSAIGSNYSEAYGVNSSGAIVGDISDSASGAKSAFLLENGKLTDLNSVLPAGSTWHLATALAINDGGQILGIGTSNGWERAFLLTPSDLGNPPDAQVVPEPGTLAVLALGIVGLVARQRRCLGLAGRS